MGTPELKVNCRYARFALSADGTALALDPVSGTDAVYDSHPFSRTNEYHPFDIHCSLSFSFF